MMRQIAPYLHLWVAARVEHLLAALRNKQLRDAVRLEPTLPLGLTATCPACVTAREPGTMAFVAGPAPEKTDDRPQRRWHLPEGS